MVHVVDRTVVKHHYTVWINTIDWHQVGRRDYSSKLTRSLTQQQYGNPAFPQQTDTLCPRTRSIWDVACLPVSASEFVSTSEFVQVYVCVHINIGEETEAEGGGSKPRPIS